MKREERNALISALARCWRLWDIHRVKETLSPAPAPLHTTPPQRLHEYPVSELLRAVKDYSAWYHGACAGALGKPRGLLERQDQSVDWRQDQSVDPCVTGCALAQPTCPPRSRAARGARLHVKIRCSLCRFSTYPM
jgi:hypothetical protein